MKVLTEAKTVNISLYDQIFVCYGRLNFLVFMIHALVWIKKLTLYTSFVISCTMLQFQRKTAS